MRFALWPNLTRPLADALAPARHADATGWDGVYIANHFMGDGGGGPFPLTVVRWMRWIWSVR